MSQREYLRQMPGQTGATLSPGLAMRLHLDAPLLAGLMVLMLGGLAVLYSAGGESMEMVVRQCCLLYTSPSPRDATLSRMPSSA